MRVTFNTKEFRAILRDFESGSDKNTVIKKLDKLLDDSCDKMLRESSKQVEKFSDTGELLGSGDMDLRPLHKEVFFKAPHAIWLEFGTDPHPPSRKMIEALTTWARRKLLADDPEGAAWAIAKKIEKEGTEAKPFLRPGFDAGVAYFKANVSGE
jgi:hypothetical protein